MSFEIGGSPDLPPDTFSEPAADTLFDGTDYYPSPDIIPEHEADTAVDTTEAPEETFNPWKLKQIHHIKGKIVEGDHPDPNFHADIEEKRKSSLAKWQKDEEALAAVPTRNTEFEGSIETARSALRRDLGDYAGSAPIKVVNVDKGVEYGILPPGFRGRLLNGQVVVGVEPYFTQEENAKQVLNVTLHEGVHARAPAIEHIETSFYLELEDSPEAVGQTKLSALVAQTNSPIVVLPRIFGPPMFGGAFYEEGLAESYRARTVQELTGGHGVEGTSLPAAFQIFTDRPEDYGHYDPEQNVVYMPWKYADAAKRLDDGSIGTRQSQGSIAAYGIDILDQHLPGLREEIQHIADDPALRAHVEARIDSIEPGLYDFLRSLDYESAAFQHGLQVVMRMTGMLDRRS